MKRNYENVIVLVMLTIAVLTFTVLGTRPAHAQQAVGTYTEQTGTDRAQIGVAPRYAISTISGIANTVTTGGVSQTVFNSNVNRAFFICQNPISATEPLFINLGTAASTAGNGSLELAPGAMFMMTGGVVFTGVIAATAATTGHYFMCKSAP